MAFRVLERESENKYCIRPDKPNTPIKCHRIEKKEIEAPKK